MTGLEKMKSQILQEADNTAREMLLKAREDGACIVEGTKKEAKKEAESIHVRSQERITVHRERIEASKKYERRTKMLAAKQEVIADVVGRAYDAVKEMKDSDYFELLLGLLGRCVQSKVGKMYLSVEDYAKLPSDFREKAKAIAKEKGGEILFFAESESVEKGFVLAYDGIEENCMIRSVFESKREKLEDTIRNILFP